MINQNKKFLSVGCKLCLLLNDGVCSNYCLLSKNERKELENKALSNQRAIKEQSKSNQK